MFALLRSSRVQILCKVEFIEFEGRSDGESIKKILAQIKPKQLVIVHGSPANTRDLAEYCEQNQIVQVCNVQDPEEVTSPFVIAGEDLHSYARRSH